LAALSAVVGRDRELRTIRSFLDVGLSGARVLLLLVGEAGIGKATVWLQAARAATGVPLRSSTPTGIGRLPGSASWCYGSGRAIGLRAVAAPAMGRRPIGGG
jgi:hypothetical protein